MPLFKNIWKGSSKHKKLCDEWDLAGNQDFDGEDCFSSTSNSTYKVKYLGHIPVDASNSTQETTAKAVEAILSVSKANRKPPQKVIVSVNLKGIEVTDRTTEKPVFDVSIFRICSCLAYAKCRRIFAFLATDVQETTECHAFLCSKRSVAENMAVTVAQTFTAVYSMWQTARRESIDTMYYGNNHFLQAPLPSYSKYNPEPWKKTESVPLTSLSSNKWISFEGSLKDAPLTSTSRSLAFAEVYVSPPAYSEKPPSENQKLDSEIWGESNTSSELIVL